MGGESLKQADKRDGRYLDSGNIEGHIGQGSEHPDLLEDVPVCYRGFGLDDL